MSDLIEDIITDVIRREAGYVNHPSDHGGPTNYGITQDTLSDWRGYRVSPSEVAALQESEARLIYRKRYFLGLEKITDRKVLEFLFDYATNSGTGRAIKALMVVLGGKNLADVDQAVLYWPLVCERLDNYLRIIGNDPSQTVFAIGWANRITEFWRPAGTPVITHAKLTPAEADGILVRGEKGASIEKLQKALISLGFDTKGADGDFGAATYAAVAAFQKSRGLQVDGVAGKKTLGELGISL